VLALSFSGFDSSQTLGRSERDGLFALSRSPPLHKVLRSR
jgi:hypothetical protein